MRAILAITGTGLRRFLRDRSNIFFVFIFPMLLVILIGLQFGGEGAGQGSVLVTGDGALSDQVEVALADEDLAVSTAASDDDARATVARGRADAAVLVDAADEAAFAAGEAVELDVVASSQATGQAAQQVVQSAITGLSLDRASVEALTAAGLTSGEARTALDGQAGAGPDVAVSTAGEDSLAEEFEGVGQFGLPAAQQVSLFVFLASLAGASFLIQSRTLGVTRRELAAPVTTGQVILGEALGRFAIALTQGLYIVVGTALLFQVDWGDWVATISVLTLFCAVSASAAMVLGAMLDNENVAGGVGVGVGLVVAALGGSMLPLELFPDALLTVSAATPHRWAYQAYAEITRRGGGIVDVLPELAVLALMTAVLLPLGAWLLRRSLQRAL